MLTSFLFLKLLFYFPPHPPPQKWLTIHESRCVKEDVRLSFHDILFDIYRVWRVWGGELITRLRWSFCSPSFAGANLQHRHWHIPHSTRHDLLGRLFTQLCSGECRHTPRERGSVDLRYYSEKGREGGREGVGKNIPFWLHQESLQPLWFLLIKSLWKMSVMPSSSQLWGDCPATQMGETYKCVCVCV